MLRFIGEHDEDEPESPAIYGYENLLARVTAKLNSGFFDPDDPDIAQYKALSARLHGSGGLALAKGQVSRTE